MYVKRLKPGEIPEALHLAWEVFEVDVAPTYPEEGVKEFQEFIKEEHLMPRVHSREMSFFGAMEGDVLCGMSAIRADGHIALLFVKKQWQRRGAARMLFYAMQQYLVIERMVVQMTVSATPNAVEAYKHLGFHPTSGEQMEDGIRFVPMAYVIKDATKIATGGRRTGAKKAGFLAFLMLFAFLGLAILGGKMFSDMLASMSEEYGIEENREQSKNEGNQKKETAGSKEAGIEGIESYQMEELPYTITEEVYTLYEYPMEFEVHYPKLVGLESECLAEINQNLKDCAMSTVEVLYLNPGEETKEAMLKQKNPVLASQVTYKITYATETFISVVFNDSYIAGDGTKAYVDLRTRNINLQDGTEYQVKDIIELSDDFMHEWKVRMKKEAPYTNVMEEMKTSDLYQILNGSILDGKYFDASFVDAEGVQIGMTFHHGGSAGWITAPFTFTEIKEFAADSEFWKMIKE